MNQHREDFCRHPGADFTRNRKISFDTLLHFQISMENGSVNHELPKYFNFDAAAPSLSAFYQHRAKLSDDVFQKLFFSFNNCFKPKSLLKGRYQLLACDGSGFTFTRNPKDTESYYNPCGCILGKRRLMWKAGYGLRRSSYHVSPGVRNCSRTFSYLYKKHLWRNQFHGDRLFDYTGANRP